MEESKWAKALKAAEKKPKRNKEKVIMISRAEKLSKNNEEKNFLNPFCVPALSKSILS